MKITLKYLTYAVVVICVMLVHTLFFIHHPPEVQLAFLTPGVTLLGYSIIRDDFYVKPHHRHLRLKKNNIFN